ncbi:MAG: molybdopterin oxidoreductase [Proteobacteria bacterium]|nr:MAG: molybdopterin oxidoreductase [Pseudomonadota bacterium]
MKSPTATPRQVEKKPTYCYQCVAGPDLLTVSVSDGVAVACEPNFSAAEVHPGGGKCCVKAYGLVQKTYNPHRITTPMKRTNPKKGRDQDPGFVAISWDEALDTIADKLREIRQKGLLDESGYARVAATFGGGGTPTYYMGTFPAFLSAWGAVDLGYGSGQGVKCYHSEHLYGEFWHRAFTVGSDTPRCDYVISCGANLEASAGVVGVWRHSNARIRGMKRVQVEPHLSVTGGCSASWVPIRPKTDAAFLYAIMHVLCFEHPLDALDVPFLRDRTAAPYLVAPNGYYMRDPSSRKPLVWDMKTKRALPFDSPDIEPALQGLFRVSGVEVGADNETWQHTEIEVRSAFEAMRDHLAGATPAWASEICDVPEDTIRTVANEYLAHARVGETIDIEGVTLPYRPVAVVLGKSVTNGWGGYECCWARTMLACLVGALEVPGGTLGTTVRLNRPATSRFASVLPDADGFMTQPLNPTDRERWKIKPKSRNAYNTLVPLVGDSPWSPALGPTYLSWLFQDKPPENWPRPTLPDLWFIYRTNPAISNWDAPAIADRMAKFPFIVALTYTRDESNHMADILLPEATDLESTQLIRMGGTKFIEQFWNYEGFGLRQKMVEPQGEAKDFTDIATELARRTGLLENYNRAINKGAACTKLSGDNYDFSLDEKTPHTPEEIWDAVCRAASAELTDGKETDGLDWFQKNGYKFKPFPLLNWYLYPRMVEQGLRFEMPFQERLYRVGQELANRLHEHGIEWWDTQLKEYQALPAWKDFPGIWQEAAIAEGGSIDDYPFWLLTARSMQYSWGANAGIQLMREVAGNIGGHAGVIINTETARKLGIEDGDLVEIRSSLRATKGHAVLRQGIRPDTLLTLGQFDHWAMPVAKDFQMPSLNTVAPMTMALMDATGSGSDLVRVGLRKLDGGRS